LPNRKGGNRKNGLLHSPTNREFRRERGDAASFFGPGQETKEPAIYQEKKEYRTFLE